MIPTDNLRRLLLNGLARQPIEVLVGLFFFLLLDLLQKAIKCEIGYGIFLVQLGHAEGAFVLEVDDLFDALLTTKSTLP